MRNHNCSTPTLHLVVVTLLVTGVVCTAVPCRAAGEVTTKVTFSGSLRNLFAETSLSSEGEATDDWRQRLDRNLLPSGRVDLYRSQRAGGADLSAWRPDSDRPLPVEVRSAFQDRAKEEVYRIASELILSWGPINRIRQALEPYSRPLQIYRAADGVVSAGLFDQKVAKGGSRVFNLRMELSPRNNLNLWAEMAGGVTIGFLEGRTTQIRWEPAGEDFTVAFYREGDDRSLLAASFTF